MIQTLDDRELIVRAARDGDAEAFADLVQRWDRRLLAFLTKATGDPDAAKDLRQEVFLRLHRYRTSYDANYAFTTWLFRIVANVLATWHAKNLRRSTSRAPLQDAADTSPSPSDCASHTETVDQVRAAIGKLSPAERQMLLLRFDLELSYREIAEILGAPETTVKSRLYALLQRLRQSLEHPEHTA